MTTTIDAEQTTEGNGHEQTPPEVRPVMVRPPDQPIVIVEEVDRLRAENVHLKLMTLVHRETVLTQQMADIENRLLPDIQREREGLNAKMAEIRTAIEQKYGISLQTHIIRPGDGMVIQRNPAQSQSPIGAAFEQLKKHLG
jgi:hypothetical protein